MSAALTWVHGKRPSPGLGRAAPLRPGFCCCRPRCRPSWHLLSVGSIPAQRVWASTRRRILRSFVVGLRQRATLPCNASGSQPFASTAGGMRSLEGKRTCAAARQTGGAGGSTDSRAKDYLANALVRVVVRYRLPGCAALPRACFTRGDRTCVSAASIYPSRVSRLDQTLSG